MKRILLCISLLSFVLSVCADEVNYIVKNVDNYGMTCVITSDNTVKVTDLEDGHPSWVIPDSIEIDGKVYYITDLCDTDNKTKSSCFYLPSSIKSFRFDSFNTGGGETRLYFRGRIPPLIDMSHLSSKNDIRVVAFAPKEAEDMYQDGVVPNDISYKLITYPFEYTDENDNTYIYEYYINNASSLNSLKLSVCGVVDKNPVSVEVQLQGVGNEDLSKGKCNIVAVSKNAFRGVESIEKVTLSSYIKSIGDSAFYGCSSIKTIELKSKTPPVLGKDVFEGLVPPVTLIVPDGCSGAYLNDPVWKSLIEEPSTVVKESSVSRKLVGTYSVSGTKIPSDEANSYKGVKISVYDDGDAVKSVVR